MVTTVAPEPLRRWTMASPMPLVPPVTSARFPANSVSEEPLIEYRLRTRVPASQSPTRDSAARS